MGPARGHAVALATAARACLAAVLLASTLPAPAAGQAESGKPEPAVVRILPLVDPVAAGPTEIEALVVDPEVTRLTFTVDGEEAAHARRPPWNARVDLGSPPREREVGVVAYDAHDRRLGEDAVVVNRVDPPFRVRIASLELDDGSAKVRAEVSVPRGAELAEVGFDLGSTRIATRVEPPFEAVIPLDAPPAATDFVRVEALLADGRRLEDVGTLLRPSDFSAEVEVNLVELQTLITVRRTGQVVGGVEAEDLEVLQDGERREIARLYPPQDVRLSLGLALDTSGSMERIWGPTLTAARQFVDRTLTARDRSFAVAFSDRVLLAHPLSDDREALYASLTALEPEGGTSLFDAVLFSLLQLVDAPGRRAVVMITDGVDYGSKADPGRIVDVARRLGVPVYVVALPLAAGAGAEATTLVHTLKLITDPTGGRLIRVGRGGGLERAFEQISAELRNQYLLTYYTDVLPGDGKKAVVVRVRERKDLDVRVVRELDGRR